MTEGRGLFTEAAHELGLRRIVTDENALARVVEVALDGRAPGHTVIVQDRTQILRDGLPIKPMVRRAFVEAGCRVQIVELDEDEPHTTPHHIGAVEAVLERGTVVVALGSGTVVDVAKHAVHGFESRVPDAAITLISAQTANSVCAFTSGLSVVTTDGVKRTVPSRLPDILLLDTTVLAQAPEEFTFGGVGDASVAAVSFADYRLSHLLGLSGWEPQSWALMAGSRASFLSRNPVLARRDLPQAETLSYDLGCCGLAMTVAGESAPLSGLEHVTSHTLDMAAAHDGRPVGNHGSQCALAAILVLIAFEKLFERENLDRLVTDAIDDDVERARVEAAFGHLDRDGRAWKECWNDYSQKIQAWRTNQDAIKAFASQWSQHRDDLRQFAADPAEFVAALAATGHPLHFEDIPTGLTADRVRWAFTNARLMRKRTTVADVLAFSGQWDDEFMDGVFATYDQLIEPYDS